MGFFSKLMSTREMKEEKLETTNNIESMEGVEIIDLETPDIGRYEEDIIEITPTNEIIIESTTIIEPVAIEETQIIEAKPTVVVDVTLEEEVIEEPVPELVAELVAEPVEELVDESEALAMAAEALLQGTISIEEKLEDIRIEKERVTTTIENLLSGREKMLKAKTYCQQLNKNKNITLSKTFEEYVDNDDFKDLPKKFYVMEVLKDTIPEVYTKPEIPATELRMALEHIHEIWEEVEKDKVVLQDEGNILRNEITQFTIAVNEMRNKHKLSPDWEGKKQPLMTMQGKLSTRREAYMKKELLMDKKIAELSEEYEELKAVFVEHSNYFSQILSEKAESFVKDPGRAKKLQALLKEKALLESRESELKH